MKVLAGANFDASPCLRLQALGCMLVKVHTISENISDFLALAGDGKLYNYRIDVGSGSLTDRKVISLGTKPISLHRFRSNNTNYVFAASDRPTIIYSNNQKLLYSNLNEDEVRPMQTYTLCIIHVDTSILTIFVRGVFVRKSRLHPLLRM